MEGLYLQILEIVSPFLYSIGDRTGVGAIAASSCPRHSQMRQSADVDFQERQVLLFSTS